MTSPRALAAAIVVWLAGLPCAAAQASTNDNISGTWEAVLENADRCHLRFRLVQSGVATFTGVLDAPQWNLKGSPLDDGKMSGNRVSFGLPDIDALFVGTLDSMRGEVSGKWTQFGVSAPLLLRKTVTAQQFNRPQDPQPPHPYFHEDVILLNPDTRLRIGGTITIPSGAKKRALIILLSDAGPHDREGTIVGHHPLLVLADRLTRAGFATWRMDDRGVGESDGDLNKASIDDLAADVRFVIGALARRDDIGPSRVGIVAHGEGGWIAARAAANSSQVCFLLLMNTPMLRGDETEFERIRSSATNAAGGPRSAVAEAEIQLLKDAAALLDRTATGDRPTAIREFVMSKLAQWPEVDRRWIGDAEGYATKLTERICSGRLRDEWKFDPISALNAVKCPVLAVMGQRDVEVPASLHAVPIKSLAASQRNITVREEPNWNHLLQYTRKLSISEYGGIDETFAPEALEAILQWCAQQSE